MKEKKSPALLLFPNLLADLPHHQPFLPASVDKAVQTIDGLIAESEKGGRRFLSRFELSRPTHLVPLALLRKNVQQDEIDFLLEPMLKGERWGLISDAGMPCIADPGSLLVERARARGIPVQAFVGPSAMFLTLMLSGLPGQQFSFHGYPPKEGKDAEKWLKKLEEQSRKENRTQIFIEAPHRNRQTLERLLETLSETTKLCVGWDLTLPTQGLLSQPISVWKKSPLPNLEKKPATFLFHTPV